MKYACFSWAHGADMPSPDLHTGSIPSTDAPSIWALGMDIPYGRIHEYSEDWKRPCWSAKGIWNASSEHKDFGHEASPHFAWNRSRNIQFVTPKWDAAVGCLKVSWAERRGGGHFLATPAIIRYLLRFERQWSCEDTLLSPVPGHWCPATRPPILFSSHTNQDILTVA